MGTRYRLRPTGAQFSLLPDWQRALVRAATTYGLIAMDIGGRVALQFESGNQYLSATGFAQSPWFTFARNQLGWPQAASNDCASWIGVADPAGPDRNCPVVGSLENPAFLAVWATAKVVPECASYAAASDVACPQSKRAPVLAVSDGTPLEGTSVTVTGSGYAPGASIRACQAPTEAAGRCPADAPAIAIVVDWDGGFAATLPVARAVAGHDCTGPSRCKVFVPDLVWDRPTGRGESGSAITVRTPLALTRPALTAASPPRRVMATAGYRYSFRATGNPAPIYSLRSAPRWLRIDARTGAVRGRVPAKLVGKSFRYEVRATNSVGQATAGPFRVRVIRPRRADLRLSLAARKTRPQGSVRYTLRVSNRGPHVARSLRVSIGLPEGAEVVRSRVKPERVEQTLRWTIKALAPSRRRTLVVVVSVPRGRHTATARVESDAIDPRRRNNRATRSITV
jgi:hypothetical protein